MTQITPSPPAAPVRRPRSIGFYLFILGLVALIPGFIFSAVLLGRNNEAQQAMVQSLMQTATQAIATSVDRQLEGMATTLRVLATARSLDTNQLGDFHKRATAALRNNNAFLIVLDANLQQLLNTRVPYGTPLGPTADPDSASLAIESGEPTVSNIFFGQTAQRFVFNVLLPVSPQQGTARLLVLTQNAARLNEALASRELARGWHVALLDRRGQVIVASADAPEFVAGSASPLQLPDDPSAPRGLWREAAIGPTPVVAMGWKVPSSGWQVVAWASRDLVERPFSDAVWSLVVGGLLLAGLVASTIWWITDRIARAVQGLAADARLLGAGEAVPERAYPVGEIALVSAAIADAAQRRLAAQAEVRFLMRELAHRSKNQMTVIAAMAKQTAKSAESVPQFVEDFERRIFGLARSTDLLLAHGASGVDLRDLFGEQIDPFCPLDSGRVTLEGPPFRLNNQAAQILGMAAHELATNAVKYGAFSREGGTLAVSWSKVQDRLEVSWREHVPSFSKHAERRGFGTVVLENMVGSALGAEVQRTLNPDGISWRFAIPLAAIDPTLLPGADPATAASKGSSSPAVGATS
jgi:two-component sensor histidine kinase